MPSGSEDLALTHAGYSAVPTTASSSVPRKGRSRIARASSGATEAPLVVGHLEGLGEGCGVASPPCPIAARQQGPNAGPRERVDGFEVPGRRRPPWRIGEFTCCGVSCASFTSPTEDQLVL